MSKGIPTIRKYMSTCPLTVGTDQSLDYAHGIMRENNIRHLPVLVGGKLAGIITQRDLALIETLKDVDPRTVTVDDAMTTEVYHVEPDAPLDEVVDEMAEHKYGCAVVMQNNHVVGIFTAVDAMKALSELLHGRLSK